jgi:hypothetical protein
MRISSHELIDKIGQTHPAINDVVFPQGSLVSNDATIELNPKPLPPYELGTAIALEYVQALSLADRFGFDPSPLADEIEGLCSLGGAIKWPKPKPGGPPFPAPGPLAEVEWLADFYFGLAGQIAVVLAEFAGTQSGKLLDQAMIQAIAALKACTDRANRNNISIDCRSLGHEWLILYNYQTDVVPSPTYLSVNGYFRARNHVLKSFLEDGLYNVVIQSGHLSIVNFTVKDGIISYDPELEGVISGAGTNALVLHGVPITIDATEVQGFITYLQVVYALQGADISNANRPFFTGNLLPDCHDINDGGAYYFIIASGVVGSFTFKVQLNGLVTYKPEFDSSVTGRGTNVLKISSYEPSAA